MGENTHQNCTRQNKNKEDPGRQQPCWGFLFCTNLTQPTRGLDIGATQFVHETLLRQRDAGRCVLLISADLDEILGVSDRVAVMYEGRIIGILNRDEADVHKIGLLMGGIAKEAADE